MIITKAEFNEMGFSWESDEQLESCIKRTDYIITALTQGRAAAALAAGGNASAYVKQAAAFQTNELLQKEYGSESSGSESGSEERYTLGDFSYSSSQENNTSSIAIEPYDTTLTVVGLLRAAGCLYGGLEAAE